ncbi:MAG: protein translocase subunit SecF [Actinomycetota bacterium]
MSVFTRLYHGDTKIDFIGRRKLWFAISGALMLISIASLGIRGLNLGIDFNGGASLQIDIAKGTHVTVKDVQNALGAKAEVVQIVGGSQVLVQSPSLTPAEQTDLSKKLGEVTGHSKDWANAVSVTDVGPKWGKQVSSKALIALVVFLLVVMLYISVRFEFKMAASAMVEIFHDLLLTAGVYSLVGFQVTPATIIAVLTILGYSLYDTVVVFDKVKENADKLTSVSRVTYSDTVNLSINQTLMRSINTSMTTVIPVGALLFVGSFLLGAATLKDLALALLVGILSGTYSSMLVGAPVLAMWKEREPRYVSLRARLAARGETGNGATRRAAAAALGEVGSATAAASVEPEPARASAGSATSAPRPSGGPGAGKKKGGKPGKAKRRRR